MHPDFSLSLPDFESITSELPDHIRLATRSKPASFLERIIDVLATPEEQLLIADKTHDIGEAYVPEDLVDLDSYDLATGRRGLQLRSVVMPDLLAMNEAARQEGIILVISSAYRSYAYQKTVYERNVRQLGQEQADRESARPGTSQHQLGTTIDFGSITDEFADTPAGKWLYDNAWRFGFSLSYPSGFEEVTGYRHEIWHYRYISRAAARMEREYFSSIQHYLLSFLDINRGAIENAYTNKGGGK